MAITLKTITGKIVIPGTTIGIRAKVTATPMTNAQALTFPLDDVVSWGPVVGYTDASGYLPAAFKIPTSSEQQAQLLWKFTAEPVDKHGDVPKSWLMGHYSIEGTGTIDLADLVDVDVNAFDQGTFVTLQSLVASGQAAATAAAASATSAAASASVASTLVTTDLGTTDGQSYALVTDANSLTGGALRDEFVARGGENLIDPAGLHLDQAASALGGYGLFLTTESRPPIIAGTDYVLLHSHNVNNDNVPSQWAYNPVVVKDTTSTTAVGGISQVYGIEVSVSNNTAEAGTPQANGQVIGLFLSYIHTVNQASAAVSIGGLTAGWNHGIWIDGIKSDGIGIKLVDDVGQSGGGPNAGMFIGLDMSQVSGFTIAAMLLGNGHKITAQTSALDLRDLIHLNTVDEIVLGDSDTPFPLRIATNSLKLQYAGGTSGTATAGAAGAVPATVQGYIICELNGSSVRIPYFAA